jgi:hypothetical protein
MILSILTNIDGVSKYLYDSVDKKILMSGTQEEMEFWKDTFETATQKELNMEHFNTIRKEYTEMLIKAGNTEEQTEIFLKNKMPHLFQQV